MTTDLCRTIRVEMDEPPEFVVGELIPIWPDEDDLKRYEYAEVLAIEDRLVTLRVLNA